MYLNFYHLAAEPFQITPDPSFLFLSDGHKEALGTLLYGIEGHKGFICITAEIGLGKTTIIRSCLDQMDREKFELVYIFDPHLSFKQLLLVIFEELGLKPPGKNIQALYRCFQDYLIQQYRSHRNVVLIIDEAQNLPVETLERMRLLSNLETAEDKLLQIVLVGQPELEDKLDLRELRQLKQRIAMRAVIAPLSRKDSEAYIRQRIEQVAMTDEPIFTPAAIRKIARYAKGVPRVINILGDNALVAGYGYSERPVNTRIVREVITDYEKTSRQKSRRPSFLFGS